MAKAPFEQHRSKKKLLGDIAMKLWPVNWFGPAIIRAHDKHQYEKDRKHVRDVFVEFRERRSRKSSVVGAGGSGSVVDLNTFLAPVEDVPLKGDLWRRRDGETADPWLLPPANEII